ncbi:hypothetical protein [Mycobacterium simiae]|uniref:hypothetical protein n=1 Tax=Mycobacterium simiae TaxID=1784 RepID=UPI00165F29E7|nr:hypothetical protein [Mycobacterium simiae]
MTEIGRVRMRHKAFGGLSVWVMANGGTTKAARRAAREAAVAAQEALARRTRANVEDLAAFFSARERADGIDERLAERLAALQEQAAARRGAQRVRGGRALRSMRDRGEGLGDIARMAGVSEKTVRELIREAEENPGAVAGKSAPPAAMPMAGAAQGEVASEGATAAEEVAASEGKAARAPAAVRRAGEAAGGAVR